jgi:hypothetical protein
MMIPARGPGSGVGSGVAVGSGEGVRLGDRVGVGLSLGMDVAFGAASMMICCFTRTVGTAVAGSAVTAVVGSGTT